MTLICSDLRPFLKSAPTDIGATKNGRSSVGADTELRSIPNLERMYLYPAWKLAYFTY